MTDYLTQGYFLTPDGRLVEVREHVVAVVDDPQAFGLSARDWDVVAARRGDPSAREAVLVKVVRHGFVRIRGHRRYLTFEGYDLDARTQQRIAAALRQLGVHPEETIVVSDLATGRSYRGEARRYEGETEPSGWRSRLRADFVEPSLGRLLRRGLGALLRRRRPHG